MFTANQEFNKSEKISLMRQLGYCNGNGNPAACNEACHNLWTDDLSKPVNCRFFKPSGVWDHVKV